jgi:hypothetical protein
MEDFAIRPSADLDAVHILEAMDSSRASASASRLPGNRFDPVLSSLDCLDATPSDRLACSDDCLDSCHNQLDPLATFGHNALEMVDIPRNIGMMSGIIADRQGLRFNCLGRVPPGINLVGTPA